jgi:hypothetical protein
MCRELGIPLTGDYLQTVDERRRRSDRYGASASDVLDELHQRRSEQPVPPARLA